MSKLALATIFCVLLPNALAFNSFFPEDAKGGKLWQMIQQETDFAVSTSSAKWFTQRLDHFSDSNEATFSQRYYENDTYWQSSKGPVLLYIGGEAPLGGIPGAFFERLARTFGAKMVALEHRFYGESVPNNDLRTTNLQYLTVQQALADLHSFRHSFESASDSHWIAVGGSYPGALSAWYRIAYPNDTNASLASSAVVQPVYSFPQFDDQVRIAVGSDCAKALQATTTAFEKEVAAGAAHSKAAKERFGAQAMCDADFFYMLADAAAMAVQYGHKDQVCIPMTTAYTNKESLLDAFEKFVKDMYGEKFGSGCFYDTRCFASDPLRWQDGRSWRWQKCSQLAYFQVAPANTSESLRSYMVDLAYHELQCATAFGEGATNASKGVMEITELYGGDHPKGHNIFFSNGGDDPWQRASVLTTQSKDVIADLAQCDLCGHCGDLRAKIPAAPQVLRQRQGIVQYLKQWTGLKTVSMNVGREEEMAGLTMSPLVMVPLAIAAVAFLFVYQVGLLQDDRY